MPDCEVFERISARRGELDVLEARLAAQLQEVRAEREESAVAQKVFGRFAGRDAARASTLVPVAVQVAGRPVLAIPHRGEGVEASALPPEYQAILAAVAAGGGPVMVKEIARVLDLDAVPAKLEPLRGKLNKLAERAWIRKLPDGRFVKGL